MVMALYRDHYVDGILFQNLALCFGPNFSYHFIMVTDCNYSVVLILIILFFGLLWFKVAVMWSLIFYHFVVIIFGYYLAVFVVEAGKRMLKTDQFMPSIDSVITIVSTCSHRPFSDSRLLKAFQ